MSTGKDASNPTNRGVFAGSHVRLVNHKRQYDRHPPEHWTVSGIIRDQHCPSGWRIELFDKDKTFGVDSSHIESITHIDEYWDDDIPF